MLNFKPHFKRNYLTIIENHQIKDLHQIVLTHRYQPPKYEINEKVDKHPFSPCQRKLGRKKIPLSESPPELNAVCSGPRPIFDKPADKPTNDKKQTNRQMAENITLVEAVLMWMVLVLCQTSMFLYF